MAILRHQNQYEWLAECDSQIMKSWRAFSQCLPRDPQPDLRKSNDRLWSGQIRHAMGSHTSTEVTQQFIASKFGSGRRVLPLPIPFHLSISIPGYHTKSPASFAIKYSELPLPSFDPLTTSTFLNIFFDLVVLCLATLFSHFNLSFLYASFLLYQDILDNVRSSFPSLFFSA